ncbi:MAG: hypothetical protein N2506_01580 [Dehalococcoidales bacterium]|nr:hypothetical protein [Dehalococcoidales bacterium]
MGTPRFEYDKYILREVVGTMPELKKLSSPFVSASEDFMKQIDGARPNFALYYILRTGMFPEPPHYHRNDEYLMFFGTDKHDMKKLGATVEIAFGEDWEKYEFSTSCLVYIPKGIQHCPVHVKKLERPFLFGHFWPMGEKVNILPAK